MKRAFQLNSETAEANPFGDTMRNELKAYREMVCFKKVCSLESTMKLKKQTEDQRRRHKEHSTMVRKLIHLITKVLVPTAIFPFLFRGVSLNVYFKNDNRQK